jgi:hypothetical protein
MMMTSISTASLTRLLTIGAALALALLIVGGAVAERVQHRAVSDRFFMGDLRGTSTVQTLHIASKS